MLRERVRLAVRCDQHAPRAVRKALAEAELGDLGWVLGDARLVASELVTNAVRHSGCSQEDDLVVSVAVDGSLKISVIDPGTSGGRAEIATRDFGFGGLGLQVVEQLAEAWGTDRQPEGHVVWATLSVPTVEESAGSRAASRSEEAQSPVAYADD